MKRLLTDTVCIIAAIVFIIALVETCFGQTPLISEPVIPSPTVEIVNLYPGDEIHIDYRPMVYTGSGLSIGSATWDVSRNIGFNRVHPFRIYAGTDRAQIFNGSRYLLALPYDPPDRLIAYGSGNVVSAATGYLVARPTPVPTLPPAPDEEPAPPVVEFASGHIVLDVLDARTGARVRAEIWVPRGDE